MNIYDLMFYVIFIVLISVGTYIKLSIYGDDYKSIKKVMFINIVFGTIIFIIFKLLMK